MNNPCEDCICLPSCIQKYKEFNNEVEMWPAMELTIKCNILQSIYFGKDNIKYNEQELANPLDIWWDNNYGQ